MRKGLGLEGVWGVWGEVSEVSEVSGGSEVGVEKKEKSGEVGG